MESMEINLHRHSDYRNDFSNTEKVVIRISQIVNLPYFLGIFCGLTIFSVILYKYNDALSPYYVWWHLLLFYFAGLLIGLYLYLKVSLEYYEIKKDHIVSVRGVLNRTINNIEMYRIKDIGLYEPLYLRIFKLSIIRIISSDRSQPFIEIEGVKNARLKLSSLRVLVENERLVKGVREFD